MKIAVIQNANKIAFMVRIVEKDGVYGSAWQLSHAKDEPLVEFYDIRYKFERIGDVILGQFVSRYNLETIRHTCGINLMGGIPDWQIDSQAAEQLKALFKMWNL